MAGNDTRNQYAEIDFKDLGQRLKAFRFGTGLNADQMAARIGVSRAALYRYEKGTPPKLDKLAEIARVLGVSLASLLGVGLEYVTSAPSFFARMHQAEEESSHLFVMFGPVPYALTTDRFDDLFPTVLREGLPRDLASGKEERERIERSFDDVVTALKRRKSNFRRRKPQLVGLISRPEVERFLRHGLIGTFDLDPDTQYERRLAAREEVLNVIDILRNPPMHVQLGVLADAVPSVTYQLFRQPQRTVLCVSPFRLGDFPNVRIGVGMITQSPEPVTLYEQMTETLWNRALKGQQAAESLATLLPGL